MNSISQPIDTNALLEGTVTPTDGGPEVPVRIIERRSGWRFVDLDELWRYRELLYFLVWRDVKVRYRQTVLGAAWAILQPAATMLVFTLFFGQLAQIPSGSVPYPLFVFTGLLPWYFFANAITAASQSIVGSQALVTKVFFPRLVIPMSAVAAHLVDFGIGFGLLLAILPLVAYGPGWGFVVIPVAVLGLTVAALAIGIFLAALTVAYRDFRFVVPFLTQLWMFITPSIYMQPNDVIGSWQRVALPLNPAHGFIANFRAAILGTDLDLLALALSGAVSLSLLVAGCFYFRRVERYFADII